MQTTYVLVEDNPFDRAQIRRILSKKDEDVQIVECENIAAARSYLKDGEANIILMDNHLPDGLGSDYAMEIAQDEKLSNIPVIMISDDPASHLNDVRKRAGKTAILSKEDMSAVKLKDQIENFLKLEKIAVEDHDETLHLLEMFSKNLSSELLAPLSRALRLARSAKLQGLRAGQQDFEETIASLEELLISTRDYVITLSGENLTEMH